MGLFKRTMRQLSRSAITKATFRPDLESLGERVVPAVHTWIGANGGNWNVAGNWDNGIPGTGDTVVFNTAVTTNMNLPDANAQIEGISFEAAGAMTLNLVNNLRISSAFNLNAISNVGGTATIQGAGSLVLVGNGTYGIGVANGKDLVINTDIAGSAQMHFIGNVGGQITVNGDVTAAGKAVVDNGELILGNNANTFSTPLTVGDTLAGDAELTIANGTTVAIDDLTVASDGFVGLAVNSKTTVENLILNGSDIQGAGAIVVNTSLTTNTSTFTSEIDAPTTLNGIDLDAAAGMAAVDLLFSGTITGTGDVIVRDGGTVRIGGTGANALAGKWDVRGATLELAKPAGTTATQAVAVGQAIAPSIVRLINSDQITNGTFVNVSVLGTFDLNGKNETVANLTVESGGKVTTGDGDLTSTGNVNVTSGEIQMGAGGRLVLGGNLNIGGVNNDLTVQILGGTIDADGGTATIQVGLPTVTFETTSALANGTFVKTGGGHMRGIGSSANAVQINVSEGKLTVLGLIPNADVATVGGTLSGTGQIGNLNATSGTVQPDVPNTPLRTANLVGSLAPTFQMKVFQINQSAQISTTGTVDLNGSKLVLDAPGNLPIGSAFTLIANDGNDPVQNAFFLVPEGKLVQAGGQTFRISYAGGTGNDVTATVVVGSATGLSSSAGEVIRAGLSTDLTAVVTSDGNASGTVQFFDGNTLLGEAAVQGGVATLPFVFSEGAHAITAVYSGDADVTGSTSQVTNLNIVPELYAVGAGVGGGVVTLRNTDGTVRATISPFGDSFTAGVRVVAADVNGDGFPDLIAGTGPGVATQVRILDGKTGAEIFAVAPFEAAFTGGVYVAAADLNGDGRAEFAITPDEGGGPRVRLFDGDSRNVLADFFGIDDPNFRGGARAAFADLNGNGDADLLLSAGFGGGPRVAGYDGTALANGNRTKLFNDFFAFEPQLRNGAFLAGGDLDGDGFAELVGGGGPGGGPRVTAFDGADLLNNTLTPVANFFAGDPNNRGGVPVAVKQLTPDTAADVIAGAGFTGGSKVTAYSGENLLQGNTDPLHSFDALAGFTGGVFVG